MSKTISDNENIITASRKWFITFYTEWRTDFYSSSLIESWLLKNFNVVSYAFILHSHDKWSQYDEEENPNHKAGTPKKEHYHLYLEVKGPIRLKTLMSRFNSDNSYCFEHVNSVNGCLSYLVHYNNKEKYQYNIEDIVTNIRDIADVIKLGVNDFDKLLNLIYEYRQISMQWFSSSGEYPTFYEFAMFCKEKECGHLVIKYCYFCKSMLSDMFDNMRHK